MNVEDRVREVMRERASELRVIDGWATVQARVRSRRRARRTIIGASLTAAAAGMAALLFATSQSDPRELRVVPPATTPSAAAPESLLDRPTGLKMILSRGEKVWLVDFDRGTFAPVDHGLGERDIGAFTIREGGAIVGSTAEVVDGDSVFTNWVWPSEFKGAPARLGEPRNIGTGGGYSPSAHPGRMWLVRLREGHADSYPGGTVTEVDLSGRTTAGPFTFPAGTEPIRFLDGTLAVMATSKDSSEIGPSSVRDLRTGRTVRSLAGPLVAASGIRVAWQVCDPDCKVHMGSVVDDSERVVALPAGWDRHGEGGEWSPDGESLALSRSSQDGARSHLMVISPEGETIIDGVNGNLQWAPSSEWLFVSYVSGGTAQYIRAVRRGESTAQLVREIGGGIMDGDVAREYGFTIY